MKRKMLDHRSWSFPSIRFPFSLFEEGEEADTLQHFHESSGLTVSEDEKFIYVEAAIPGIKPEEIEMIFENGMLWIKAIRKEETEDVKKKFYRKATNAFSYRVAIPAVVEEKKPPEALYKNGILKVVFTKVKAKKSKKIPVKADK
jgi:HSP20 family protein